MPARLLYGYLARQFAQPSGLAGRLFVGGWLDRISRSMNALALERLDLQRHDRVLEIGFGGGNLLRQILAATNAEVTGIDASEAMVARARRRFREEARLTLAHASVEALPLLDGSFDKAVSVNSLYFWLDPGRAFAEFARVLKPGGRLLICFEPADELRKWPGHRHGFRLYEVAEVKTLMESSGFEDVEETWGTGRKPDRFCCMGGTLANSA
jgi:arsenite methyltransferase